MMVADVIAALDLPSGSRVDQRVPKKLLLDNAAATTADKRRINEGIAELTWVATLKPTTIGVPEYRDGAREYLEIAVLRLTLRAAAKVTRLVELVHRAVPYPVLLLADQAACADLSAAHKRWAQNEAGKTVLDGDVIATGCGGLPDSAYWPAFGAALALSRQSRGSLYALYQGWIDTLFALKAARVTGAFTPAADGEHAAARRDALRECARLDGEIVRLRSLAAKERQVGRRVELNLALQGLDARLAEARHRL